MGAVRQLSPENAPNAQVVRAMKLLLVPEFPVVLPNVAS
jgi:hypothetical protein